MPHLQAVYTALKETEQRSTDVLPLWKVPLLRNLIPRQQKAAAAVALIRETTSGLIEKCKAMVDADEQACFGPLVSLCASAYRSDPRAGSFPEPASVHCDSFHPATNPFFCFFITFLQ